MKRIFVFDTLRRPSRPCEPSRACRRRRDGKAAVERMEPFTRICMHLVAPPSQAKAMFAPWNQATDTDRVNRFSKPGQALLFGADLNHRGHSIRTRWAKRAIPWIRQNRDTPYRQSRYNCTPPVEWLQSWLQNPIGNVLTLKRISFAPVTAAVETVRFEPQARQHPEIGGMPYPQDEPGYAVRAYRFWDRMCTYGNAEHRPLAGEYIHIPEVGSDRVSSLIRGCKSCQQTPGNIYIRDCHAPPGLAGMLVQTQAPLRRGAIIHAAHHIHGATLTSLDLPVGSGLADAPTTPAQPRAIPRTFG